MLVDEGWRETVAFSKLLQHSPQFSRQFTFKSTLQGGGLLPERGTLQQREREEADVCVCVLGGNKLNISHPCFSLSLPPPTFSQGSLIGGDQERSRGWGRLSEAGLTQLSALSCRTVWEATQRWLKAFGLEKNGGGGWVLLLGFED